MKKLQVKKLTKVFLMVSVCLLLAACGKKDAEDDTAKKEMQPEATQMKAICELATMDCYYHNVAKYEEKDASGHLWWKKDRKFWIEYAGIVKIGIDVTQVNMEVEDDVVTISIPPAKVLSCKVDDATLTDDSFIIADDSAKVGAEHQTMAFQEAQSNMEQAAGEDTALLASAEQRAQELLEGYVNNIGEAIGKTYQIKWVYLDDDAQATGSTDAVSEE